MTSRLDLVLVVAVLSPCCGGARAFYSGGEGQGPRQVEVKVDARGDTASAPDGGTTPKRIYAPEPHPFLGP